MPFAPPAAILPSLREAGPVATFAQNNIATVRRTETVVVGITKLMSTAVRVLATLCDATFSKSALRGPKLVPDSHRMEMSDTSIAPAGISEASSVPKAKSAAQIEWLRGIEEARAQLALLAQQWPAIFTAKLHEIRPLASTVVPMIVETLGWTDAYSRGVLTIWKARTPYCRAILSYDHRVHLDGSLSEEQVDDEARRLARAQLARRAARSPRLPAKKPETIPAAAVAPNDKQQDVGRSEMPKRQKTQVASVGALQAALRKLSLPAKNARERLRSRSD